MIIDDSQRWVRVFYTGKSLPGGEVPNPVRLDRAEHRHNTVPECFPFSSTFTQEKKKEKAFRGLFEVKHKQSFEGT